MSIPEGSTALFYGVFYKGGVPTTPSGAVSFLLTLVSPTGDTVLLSSGSPGVAQPIAGIPGAFKYALTESLNTGYGGLFGMMVSTDSTLDQTGVPTLQEVAAIPQPLVPSGPVPVTITCVDSLGAPVPSVTLSIPGAGVAVTSPSGTTTVGLNQTSYTVHAAPSNGVIFESLAFIVGTSGGSYTISGSAAMLPPPATGTERCTVYLTLANPRGDECGTLTFSSLPSHIGSGWLVGESLPAGVDASGRLVWENIPQGATVSVYVSASELVKTYIVPTAPLYELL